MLHVGTRSVFMAIVCVYLLILELGAIVVLTVGATPKANTGGRSIVIDQPPAD